MNQLNDRISAADDIFSQYDFGDGVTCEESDNWNHDDMSDLNRIVYVSYDDDPEDADTHKASFHVRFDDHGRVEDAYALDMEKGNEIGARGDFVIDMAAS